MKQGAAPGGPAGNRGWRQRRDAAGCHIKGRSPGSEKDVIPGSSGQGWSGGEGGKGQELLQTLWGPLVQGRCLELVLKLEVPLGVSLKVPPWNPTMVLVSSSDHLGLPPALVFPRSLGHSVEAVSTSKQATPSSSSGVPGCTGEFQILCLNRLRNSGLPCAASSPKHSGRPGALAPSSGFPGGSPYLPLSLTGSRVLGQVGMAS